MVWLLSKPDEDIIRELEKQNDRSAAIVGASCLEDRLESLMRHGFERHDDVSNQIFKGYGPLASFKGKIDIGLLIGMYDKKAHKELCLIKDIRNEFAHNTNASTFAHQRIKDLSCNLPPPPRIEASENVTKSMITPEILHRMIKEDPHISLIAFAISSSDIDSPRNRFMHAIKHYLFWFQMLTVIIDLRHELLCKKAQMINRTLDKTGDDLFDLWPWSFQKISSLQTRTILETERHESKKRGRAQKS